MQIRADEVQEMDYITHNGDSFAVFEVNPHRVNEYTVITGITVAGGQKSLFLPNREIVTVDRMFE